MLDQLEFHKIQLEKAGRLLGTWSLGGTAIFALHGRDETRGVLGGKKKMEDVSIEVGG